MKRIIVFLIAAACLAGCTFGDRMKAPRDAIEGGFVEGVTTNDFHDAMVWCTGNWQLGPFSKISGLTSSSITNGTQGTHNYVFYLGKYRENGDWYVFACMEWVDGEWKTVPVKFPPQQK